MSRVNVAVVDLSVPVGLVLLGQVRSRVEVGGLGPIVVALAEDPASPEAMLGMGSVVVISSADELAQCVRDVCSQL